MNALIIYTSIHHGSTEKIAQAIADVLNARIVKPSEIKSEEINKICFLFIYCLYLDKWLKNRNL